MMRRDADVHPVLADDSFSVPDAAVQVELAELQRVAGADVRAAAQVRLAGGREVQVVAVELERQHVLDQLDITRSDAGQHMSFGNGIHHCLGSSLARTEAQVAIGALVRRFPDLELAGEPERNGRVVLRGLESLPVTLGP